MGTRHRRTGAGKVEYLLAVVLIAIAIIFSIKFFAAEVGYRYLGSQDRLEDDLDTLSVR